MDQSILYVDIENLQDMAKQLLKAAIEQWPEDFPRPGKINLYVKADQIELWKIWSGHNFSSIEISIKGVQHYTFNGSKNSADLLLALDAISDLLKERTRYIAVLSDDSDYVSLFSMVKRETGADNGTPVPFKWMMTDRPDTHSQLLSEFFPPEYIHTVSNSRSPKVPVIDKPVTDKPVIDKPVTDKPVIDKPVTDKPVIDKPVIDKPVIDKPRLPLLAVSVSPLSEEEKIARAVIQNIPVGPFKSTDCKKVIARFFPKHDLSRVNNAAFGTQFSRDIWPILEGYGVQLPNSNRKPKKYEMTEEAKKKTAPSAEQPDNGRVNAGPVVGPTATAGA